MTIKKIMTFKSGKFILSWHYNEMDLQRYQIEAKILYETVKDLPILPELASTLEEELIRRSIFGTAAIEGNPLNQDRVNKIISESNQVMLKEKAEIEIRNLKEAYEFIRNITEIDNQFKVEENFIKKVHSVITRNVKEDLNVPGNYRSYKVQVGDNNHGGIYTPPKCLEDIKILMKEYVEWINSDEIIELGPIIRAGLSHYYLGLIHPFGNGNGRTARLIEAILVRVNGIRYVPTMLSNYYYRNIDDYFWSFSNARKNKDGNVTPFLEFVFRGFVESLYEIKGRITYFIRKFALRDYYAFLRDTKKVAQRQYDLLNQLLDYGNDFSLHELFENPRLNILYRNVSERTARRDMKKLLENGWIVVTKDHKYALNWKTIG